MKKRTFLTMLLVLLVLAAWAEGETIVTSFYPVHVLTLMVTDGIDALETKQMAQQQVGCLHDYTLQSRDMALLEEADVFVINGGGMEAFMDRVAAGMPELTVIESTAGIEMEPSVEEGLLNAHVWLDPCLAQKMVENICTGLCERFPQQAGKLKENADAAAERLSALDGKLAALLEPAKGQKIITFHEAFDYFAARYGIEVAGVIANEPGEEPSTRQIAETCDQVRELGISTLFIEPQYPSRAAETIARETGAALYTLDPITSGDGTKDSYFDAQEKNAQVLMEAFSL